MPRSREQASCKTKGMEEQGRKLAAVGSWLPRGREERIVQFFLPNSPVICTTPPPCECVKGYGEAGSQACPETAPGGGGFSWRETSGVKTGTLLQPLPIPEEGVGWRESI